jgi:hypothetical protein
MLRNAAVAALCAALSGCGLGSYLTPPSQTPPAAVAPPDVAGMVTALSAYKGAPADYLNLGVLLSNNWCTAYLNTLTQAANQMEFGASTATVAGTLAAGTAGALNAGVPATAIMGLAFPAINQTLVAEGRMATAGVDPGVVYGLVVREQGAYLGALPSAGPASVTEAALYVASYGALCQPAAIRSAVLQAGTTAVASAQSAQQATPAAMGAALDARPAVHAPPVVTINAQKPPPLVVPPAAPTAPAKVTAAWKPDLSTVNPYK